MIIKGVNCIQCNIPNLSFSVYPAILFMMYVLLSLSPTKHHFVYYLIAHDVAIILWRRTHVLHVRTSIIHSHLRSLFLCLSLKHLHSLWPRLPSLSNSLLHYPSVRFRPFHSSKLTAECVFCPLFLSTDNFPWRSCLSVCVGV